MIDYSVQNKKAWEYNAYEFWVKQSGTPSERAKRDIENLLAILGAEVTVFDGEMAHARFFEKDIREQMPKCSYRKYTISEIINSVINNGFVLKKFDEHPAWTNSNIPGEFTIIASKS